MTTQKYHPKWLTQKNLNRILVLIILGLAYLAGYYQSAYKLEQKKLEKLQQQVQAQ